MKRLKWIIPAAVLIILIAAGLLFMRGKSFTVGYCIVADNNSRLIVMDNSPVKLVNRSFDEDMLYKYDTGDKLLVLHDGINETYPGSTAAYYCMKIGEGSAKDIPDDVFLGLAELGWLSAAYLEETGVLPPPDITFPNSDSCPEAYAFTARYIRTNGGSEGYEYPSVIVIRSLDELNAYIDENNKAFDFDSEFIPACAAYDEEYFQGNDLILIRLEEGSGSIRHEITDVRRAADGWQVSIDRVTPEVGTCDMAQWHILLEIQMGKVVGENEAVNLVFDSFTPVSYACASSTMSLDIPDGWSYSIKAENEDSFTSGISFWPAGESKGKIKLYYYPGGFGVCGTGLEEKELKLTNGFSGRAGYYGGSTLWNYITIDGKRDFAFTHEQADWLSEYTDEIFKIISSVNITDTVTCYIEADLTE